VRERYCGLAASTTERLLLGFHRITSWLSFQLQTATSLYISSNSSGKHPRLIDDATADGLVPADARSRPCVALSPPS
jgi:hypothetical protein